jgi:hypothetical protein
MPITSLTVAIVPSGGGTALLSLPMTDFTVPANDGNGSYGVWTLTSPITTIQLPVGTYEVDVTAASSDASITGLLAGTLSFVNEVSFPTFSSSGTTFSYDNQNVTFTGTATVLAPGGTPAPLASQPLVLMPGSQPVMTATDGSFSVAVPAQSASFYVESQRTPTTAYATSSLIAITVTQFPVTMNAALTVPHPKYGQPDQATGTLTYVDGGVTKPLAGTTVSLYSSLGATPTATAVTDSNGKFAMPVPTTQDDAWIVQSPASTYFAAAAASLPMTVAQPNYIRNFRASMNAFAQVQVSGCVGTSSGNAEVQYAAGPSGPWHNLGRWAFHGIGCTGSGAEFSGTYNARLASAYYRAVYTASYSFQGAVSNSVHLSRLFTKITSFKVSPQRVAAGGHFTVSGRLWAQGKHGKWSPYGHRRLIVVFRYQGTWYRYQGEPKTSAAGWFSGRFVVYASSPVFAQYNGDATHFASASNRIQVTRTRAVHAAGQPAATSFLLAPQLAAAFRLAG